MPTFREDITVGSTIRSSRHSKGRVLIAAALAAIAGVATLIGTAGSNPTPSAAALGSDLGLGNLTLGNLVWNDKNDNGVHDNGEPGIDGVTIKIFAADASTGDRINSSLGTATTAGGGLYQFTGLSAGAYYVEFNAPGYVSSTDHSGVSTESNNPNTAPNDTDHGRMRGGLVTTYSTGVVLDVQGNRDDVDFGLFAPTSIGGQVWLDVNGNALLDSGEPGIAGVGVCIFDGAVDPLDPNSTPLAIKKSDATGNFNFGNLGEGTYRLIITKDPNFPAGGSSSPTPQNPPTGVHSNGISENANRIATGVITVTAGQANIVDIDFGVVPAGGPVTTTPSATSTTVGPTTTVGTNPTTTMSTAGTSSIGDFVWDDANNNGVFDPGENGLGGVSITLHADANSDGVPDGAALQATVTDNAGAYHFDGVQPGNYVVSLTPPNGYASSTGAVAMAAGPYEAGKTQAAGANGQDHGTQAGALVRSSTVTVGATSVTTIDFGLFRPMTIGNRVWNDIDNDGLLTAADGASPGMAGIAVCIFDGSGLLATQFTDANGRYLFGYLVPGTYRIVLVKSSFPANFVAGSTTATSANPNNHVDNDNNGVTDSGSTLDAAAMTISMDGAPTGESDAATDPTADNRSDLTVDFALRDPSVAPPTKNQPITQPTTLGPSVAATVPPATTPELAPSTTSSIPVAPTTTSSTLAAPTTLSDASGPARAASSVVVVTEATTTPTTNTPTTTPTTTTTSPTTGPTTGHSIKTTSNSVAALATACQTLWVDLNGDGKKDANEDALSGVTVALTSPGPDGATGTADDVAAMATTDANGQYCLTIPAGIYGMRITGGLPAKYAVLGTQALKVQVKGIQISRAPANAKLGPTTPTPADTPNAPVDTLPLTGTDSGLQTSMAVLAMAIGVALFFVSRRRGLHSRPV